MGVSENKKFTFNFVWNFVGSTLYACTSLIFMIIVTRINGIENAGLFTFCFSFICIIQVIGTFAGRPYQVTDNDPNINNSDYLNFRIVNCIVMIIFCIGFCLYKDYDISKNMIIFLLLFYKIIDTYSEVFYGIFQKNNNLYQAGISLTLRSIVTVLTFLIGDLITKNLILSIIFMIISNLTIFIFYDIRKFNQYKIKWHKFSINKTKILFIGGFAVFIFTFLMQYVINSPKFAIDSMMTDTEQAIFGIILMPATVMTLCSQLIAYPYLRKMGSSLKNQNVKIFKITVFKICLEIFAAGLFLIIICYFVGIPILDFIYGTKLDDQLIPLMIIISGSVIFGMSTALSYSLIALRKNWIQVIIVGVTSITSWITSQILVYNNGIIGASMTFAISSLLIFSLYIISFIIESRKLYER